MISLGVPGSGSVQLLGGYVKCDTAEYAKRSPLPLPHSLPPLRHNMRRNQIDAKCKFQIRCRFLSLFGFFFSFLLQQLPKLNERNLDKWGGGYTPVNDINLERYCAHKNLHMDEEPAALSVIANPHPHPHLEIITQRSNGHWPASASASCL